MTTENFNANHGFTFCVYYDDGSYRCRTRHGMHGMDCQTDSQTDKPPSPVKLYGLNSV